MIRTIIIAGLLGIAPAVAAPVAHAEPSVTVTVDGVDYPVCHVEDCSDQVGQVGVWTNPRTGKSYLELGENVTLFIHPEGN